MKVATLLRRDRRNSKRVTRRGLRPDIQQLEQREVLSPYFYWDPRTVIGTVTTGVNAFVSTSTPASVQHSTQAPLAATDQAANSGAVGGCQVVETASATQTFTAPGSFSTGFAGIGVTASHQHFDSVTNNSPFNAILTWQDSSAYSQIQDPDEAIQTKLFVLRDPSGANLSGNAVLNFSLTTTPQAPSFQRDIRAQIYVNINGIFIQAGNGGTRIAYPDGTVVLNNWPDFGNTTFAENFSVSIPLPTDRTSIPVSVAWGSYVYSHPQGFFNANNGSTQDTELGYSFTLTATGTTQGTRNSSVASEPSQITAAPLPSALGVLDFLPGEASKSVIASKKSVNR